MFMGRIACAVGKHAADPRGVRQLYSSQVGRCRHCRKPLENDGAGWRVLAIHDAGLDRRAVD